MNKQEILELAKEAGFIFWDDENYKPDGAIIDWSCEYDAELLLFAKLLEAKVKGK